MKDKILELGDIDIDIKKVYIAFKGIRNIVDIEVYKNFIEIIVNVKKGVLNDPLNIMNCYVLDDGKIVEEGSFDELIVKKNGKFAHLWKLQQIA